MASVLKTLDTTITYRFQDGTLGTFKGEKCYRLANSWWDAKKQAERACQDRGESFEESRIGYLHND